MLMSDIEIITDGGRRRRWSATEKLRIVEETLQGTAGSRQHFRRRPAQWRGPQSVVSLAQVDVGGRKHRRERG